MGIADLTASTANQTIASYHAFVAHLPVIFFVAALVSDLMYYFGKTQSLKIGHWLVIFGVIACMPVLFTGLAAAQNAHVENPFLAKHISLGYTTAVATSLYAGFRISVLWWKFEVPTSFYLMLSIITVALVSWTADYGWLAKIPLTG